MPQDSTIDLDRQVRTEQMVLTVHAAYRKACDDFDDFSALFVDKQVTMQLTKICFVIHILKHVENTKLFIRRKGTGLDSSQCRAFL